MIVQRRIAALSSSFDDAGPVAESRAEKHVRVHEQALFQREDDELHPAEPCAEERAV
jgi:hypothetical protein